MKRSEKAKRDPKATARRPATIEDVHQAFLTARPNGCMQYPTIAAVARGLGVRPADAQAVAAGDLWELERRALRAREWHEACGLGAKTEEEFCERYPRSEPTYGPGAETVAEGPEGAAYVRAFARDLWRRCMGPLLEWEAGQELEEAEKALQAIRAFRREAEKARRAA